MVAKELARQPSLTPLSPSLSFLTNLQNMKQCLKSDYKDADLLRVALLSMNFTELLIEEHLGNKKT